MTRTNKFITSLTNPATTQANSVIISPTIPRPPTFPNSPTASTTSVKPETLAPTKLGLARPLSNL